MSSILLLPIDVEEALSSEAGAVLDFLVAAALFSWLDATAVGPATSSLVY